MNVNYDFMTVKNKEFVERCLDDFNKIAFNKSIDNWSKFNALKNSVRINQYVARYVVEIAGKIVNVCEPIKRTTLLHLAMYDNKAAAKAYENRLILRIADIDGISVAHMIARFDRNINTVKRMMKDEQIATLSDNEGNTVAHQAANIYSIAVEMIERMPEIVNTKNSSGISVMQNAENCRRHHESLMNSIFRELGKNLRE